MILKELTTCGYRQLPDGTYTFDGNLIGIIGRNGSGKSHLIEALPFLLTGDGQRKKMLRWGASSGHVLLKFSHIQREYAVRRNLHDAGAALSISGPDLDQPIHISGSDAVTDSLGKAISIDKDTARHSMFARQAEIDAVLFTEPKERETALQRLCGVGDAQKVHKALGDILSKFPTQYDLDNDITKAERELLQAKSELASAEVDLAKCNSEMDKIPPSPIKERDEAQARLYKVQTYFKAVGDLNGVDASIRTQEVELASIVVPSDDPAAIEACIQAYSAAIVDLRHEQEWKKKLTEVEVALGVLQSPPSQEQLSALQAAISAAVEQMSRASMSREMYANLMAAVSSLQGTQVCPLCGSYITDVDRLKRDVVAKLEAVNLAYVAGKQEREKAEASFRTLSDSRTALELARTRLEASKDKLSQDLVALAYTEAKCNGSVKEAESALAAERAKLAAISEGRNRMSRIHGNLDSLQASRAGITGFLNSQSEAFRPDEESRLRLSIEQCNDNIEKARKVESAVANAQGRIDVLRHRTVSLQAELDMLQGKRSKAGPVQGAFKTLGNVRDWFHYSVGPHAIAVSFLRRLTQGVNEFLGYFSAPFVVSPEESTLGFLVNFTDGRSMPPGGYADAAELSGGEKIMLAVSFRLANYRIFASKLGILSLDEPTVYLDDENVGNFCKVVEALKGVVQAMNLQVLIATHERAVMPYFSSTINLNSKGE